MDKSLFTTEYAVLLRVLRGLREQAGITQVELAKRLGQSQSFVSKYERGETRLDLIQLRTICRTLGTSLSNLVELFEKRLSQVKRWKA